MDISRINKYIVAAMLFLVCLSNEIQPQEYGVVNEVNLDSLGTYVRVLSGEIPVVINGDTVIITSRHSDDPHNDLAADYIKKQLESFGLLVFDENYSPNGRNIVAVQTGSLYPDQQYVIGAHYDSMPVGPIAPGADDNASGTAAVLEAARLLSQYQNLYTIIYALFDEEEQGLIGAYNYVYEAVYSGDQINCMVNIDMIGWDNDNDGVILINTLDHALQHSSLAEQVIYRFDLPLEPWIINPGLGSSDHRPFWEAGLSAIAFMENWYGDANGYYHTINDRFEHFNLPYLHNSAKSVIGTLATMVQGYQEFSEIVFSDTLGDTEDINNPITVTVSVHDAIGFPLDLSTLALISGLDSSFSDTIIMTQTDDPVIFAADIPAAGSGGVMRYYASISTLTDLDIREPYGAPGQHFSFNVGPDQVFPQIEYITTIEDQLYPVGSKDIVVRASDNIGVSSVTVRWRVNQGADQSIPMVYQSGSDNYRGILEWNSLTTGDSIVYWVEVMDASSNSNTTISNEYVFSITPHYAIGEFEGDFIAENWETGAWGIQYFNADYGNCLNDSPNGRYHSNAFNPCTIKDPIDLTYFEHAYLHFYSIQALEPDHDFGYVQLSVDSMNWETRETVTGLWETEDIYISLDDLLTEDSVYIRLLVTSDESEEYFGWFVDDITLILNEIMPVVSSVEQDLLPGEITLHENFPNPFNPITTIRFDLPEQSDITLTLYDILGREVEILINDIKPAGAHTIQWDATNVASGMYLYQIRVYDPDAVGAGEFVQTRKMVVLK